MELENNNFLIWKNKINELKVHSKYSYDNGIQVIIYDNFSFYVFAIYNNSKTNEPTDIRLGYIKKYKNDKELYHLQVYFKLSNNEVFISHCESEASLYTSSHFVNVIHGRTVSKEEFKEFARKHKEKQKLISKIKNIP